MADVGFKGGDTVGELKAVDGMDMEIVSSAEGARRRPWITLVLAWIMFTLVPELLMLLLLVLALRVPLNSRLSLSRSALSFVSLTLRLLRAGEDA
jgi:hypothetical protein